MDLDGDRADGVGVKGFEGVYQSDGYNGALGFRGGLKASSLKFLNLVSVFGTGSFCKDNIIPSGEWNDRTKDSIK